MTLADWVAAYVTIGAAIVAMWLLVQWLAWAMCEGLL